MTDRSVGRCLTQFHTENSKTITEKNNPLSFDEVASSVVPDLVKSAVLTFLEMVKHPVDAAFSWAIGVIIGLQDLIQTIDMAHCKLPNFFMQVCGALLLLDHHQTPLSSDFLKLLDDLCPPELADLHLILFIICLENITTLDDIHQILHVLLCVLDDKHQNRVGSLDDSQMGDPQSVKPHWDLGGPSCSSCIEGDPPQIPHHLGVNLVLEELVKKISHCLADVCFPLIVCPLSGGFEGFQGQFLVDGRVDGKAALRGTNVCNMTCHILPVLF